MGCEGELQRQRGGGFSSLYRFTSALALTLSFVFLFSPPNRARSGARRRQRGVPGGCRPLPLGHPPRSPPPRLLIRERRVPGGLAAPLPRRGLGRRAARGLLSVGRAMHRRTGGGAERPRMAPSPTCRDRSRRRLRCTDPTTCHQTVTRHHRPGDVARHGRCPLWLPHLQRWGHGAVGAGAAQSLHRDVRLVVSLSRLCPKRPQG